MDSTRRAGKPHALSNNYLSWIRPAWVSSQDEIIRVGGFDAAMYIKILSFGELCQPIWRESMTGRQSEKNCCFLGTKIKEYYPVSSKSVNVMPCSAERQRVFERHMFFGHELCCNQKENLLNSFLAAFEIFCWTSLWVIIIILPTNLVVS